MFCASLTRKAMLAALGNSNSIGDVLRSFDMEMAIFASFLNLGWILLPIATKV